MLSITCTTNYTNKSLKSNFLFIVFAYMTLTTSSCTLNRASNSWKCRRPLWCLNVSFVVDNGCYGVIVLVKVTPNASKPPFALCFHAANTFPKASAAVSHAKAVYLQCLPQNYTKEIGKKMTKHLLSKGSFNHFLPEDTGWCQLLKFQSHLTNGQLPLWQLQPLRLATKLTSSLTTFKCSAMQVNAHQDQEDGLQLSNPGIENDASSDEKKKKSDKRRPNSAMDYHHGSEKITHFDGENEFYSKLLRLKLENKTFLDSVGCNNFSPEGKLRLKASSLMTCQHLTHRLGNNRVTVILRYTDFLLIIYIWIQLLLCYSWKLHRHRQVKMRKLFGEGEEEEVEKEEEEEEVKTRRRAKSAPPKPFESTVPKPFQMMVREEQKQKDRDMVKELVPDSGEDTSSESAQVQFKAKTGTKTRPRTPCFKKWSKRNLKGTLLCSVFQRLKANCDRYAVGPISRMRRAKSVDSLSVYGFRAKPFPKEIFTDFAYEKMKEDLAFRKREKVNKTKRAFRATAKYPPRMANSIAKPFKNKRRIEKMSASKFITTTCLLEVNVCVFRKSTRKTDEGNTCCESARFWKPIQKLSILYREEQEC